MEYVDDELTEEYEGKVIRSDFEDADYDFEFDGERIILRVIDRPYYTEETLLRMKEEYYAESRAALSDDEDDSDIEPFSCEEENLTVTMDAIVTLEEDDIEEEDESEESGYIIREISFENKIFGDSGLGDADPNDIFTEEEFEASKQALRDFLADIILG